MEELEIRQNVIALHNDLRTVNMPDQYKALFVSILMLDEIELLPEGNTDELIADISDVINLIICNSVTGVGHYYSVGVIGIA